MSDIRHLNLYMSMTLPVPESVSWTCKFRNFYVVHIRHGHEHEHEYDHDHEREHNLNIEMNSHEHRH